MFNKGNGWGTIPSIASLGGPYIYKGEWNASTNTPALASGVGDQGDWYYVGVSGSTNLDGITDWKEGDNAAFNGTAWQKIDNTNDVSSVDGEVGAIDGRYSQAIFFGKGGSDTKDGKSYITRKVTLAAAKAAAAALTPAINNQIAIICEDAGSYVENYTNNVFVHLIAPAAKITGNIVIAEDSMIDLGVLDGNLTVNAAKVLRGNIKEITGTITKTGKMRGFFNDDLYVKGINFEV